MDANKILRRSRMDLWTPAELAIFNAMQEVEKAGAHPKLTEVVLLLSKAQDTLADYVDEAAKIAVIMTKEDNIFRRHL